MKTYDAGLPREVRFLLNDLGLSTQALRASLLSHPIYDRIDDVGALRVFMESHVFAVWDFMSLLKSLQRAVTCTTVPWVPPPDRICARLINEIVLEEESDEPEKGRFTSHFELYIDAMREVGADPSAVLAVVESVRRGEDPRPAMQGVPIATREFTLTTLRLAGGPPHAVAAAFLLGRESIIPGMFRRILGEVNARGDRWSRVTGVVRRKFRTVDRYANLRLYLDRHIDLDGGDHTPMGERLLMVLCGTDKRRWEEAGEAARTALRARIEMWSGLCERLG